VWDPTNTVGALRRARIPAAPGLVRAGGLVEVVIGVVAIVTGVPVAAALVALSYLAFSAFVVFALVRHLPIGSCGCFGKVDTPPSVVHIVLNAGAIVVATAVAVRGGGGIGEVLADQDLLGLPFLLFVATATYLAFLALTLLPQLRSLEADRPETAR
jgi:Methylamine utilisation protein MauE